MSGYYSRSQPEFRPKTIYDLFRHLVNAISFTSQTEKEEYLGLSRKVDFERLEGLCTASS